MQEVCNHQFKKMRIGFTFTKVSYILLSGNKSCFGCFIKHAERGIRMLSMQKSRLLTNWQLVS